MAFGSQLKDTMNRSQQHYALHFPSLTCFLAVIFSLMSLSNTANAQAEFAIKPLFDLNTTHDEIACMLLGEDLVFMRADATHLVNTPMSTSRPRFVLKSAERGEDFSQWMKAKRFFRPFLKDVGPATYDAEDSLMYFSSAENFGHAQGPQLKIYSSRWDGKRWGAPQLVQLGIDRSEYCHPHYVAEHRMLIFTSNRFGGMGGMDVWYVLKTENGWTEPVNPGLGVNSMANEIFPTYHAGDIFFATNRSDTWGGYDIRRAYGRDQWKSSVAEAAPINSAADDVSLLFLSDDKAILTSNRAGGRGGDDLFLLQRNARPEELHNMQARLECGGIPSANALVSIRNASGELVQSLSTSATGQLDISALRLKQAYDVQLEGDGSTSFESCILIISDAFGNFLMEIRFDAKGKARLELLPFQYNAIDHMEVSDESLLQLNLEGQLYTTQPGDIGRGEPITILDNDGQPVAIAYTNDVGKFRFTRLDPQLKYVMRLSEKTQASHVLITDKGEKIALPVLNAEINYQRVAAEDAITLVNEFNDSIQVSTKDLFVINRIYYEYNSPQLTPEAERQLNQLAVILERNTEIGLELYAHTDSRGEASYNLKLSESRAKSAVQYLSAQGIIASRCTFKGLGESHLLNECEDGVACTEPEHAINRRTEIRLKRTVMADLMKQ